MVGDSTRQPLPAEGTPTERASFGSVDGRHEAAYLRESTGLCAMGIPPHVLSHRVEVRAAPPDQAQAVLWAFAKWPRDAETRCLGVVIPNLLRPDRQGTPS